MESVNTRVHAAYWATLDVIAKRDVRTSKGSKLAQAGPDSGGENAVTLQKLDKMILAKTEKGESTSFKLNGVMNPFQLIDTTQFASPMTPIRRAAIDSIKAHWPLACKHQPKQAFLVLPWHLRFSAPAPFPDKFRLMLAYSPPTIKIPKRSPR